MGNFFSYIVQGTAITVGVTLVALPFGLVLGLLMSLVHTYGGKILNRIAALYSLLLRGVPPIVLLFILYFVLSGTINLSPFWAGSFSLGIVSSAYQMEILRGALLLVGGGQMTAARAIGMSRLQSIQYIVLPQALRLAIPPWSKPSGSRPGGSSTPRSTSTGTRSSRSWPPAWRRSPPIRSTLSSSPTRAPRRPKGR